MKQITFKQILAVSILALWAMPCLAFAEVGPEFPPSDPIPPSAFENTLPACTDGIDNDEDGLTDFADPDCAAFIPAPPSEDDPIEEEGGTSEVTVIVNVINNNGGAQTAASATVNVVAGNPTPASFAGAAAPGTAVSINPGSYSVLSTGITNYTTTLSPECSGSLSTEQSTTCTITLDDIAPPSGGGGGGGGGSASFGAPSCSGSECGGASVTPPAVDNPPLTHGIVLGETIDKQITPPTAPTITPPVAPTACSEPYLHDYIRYGHKNNPDQVKKLQTFLNSYLNAGLDVNGKYDLKTFNAVKAFQVKESQEVLNPWHLAGFHISFKGTGYVYKTTLRRINNIMCDALNIPMPVLK